VILDAALTLSSNQQQQDRPTAPCVQLLSSQLLQQPLQEHQHGAAAAHTQCTAAKCNARWAGRMSFAVACSS